MTAPETFTTAPRQPLTKGRRPDMTAICAFRPAEVDVKRSCRNQIAAAGVAAEASERFGGLRGSSVAAMVISLTRSQTTNGNPGVDLASSDNLKSATTNTRHSSVSPCKSALAPSVLSKVTSTFLPSKARVHFCVSPCPRTRRSTTKVWSSSQLPLTASMP